MSGGGGGGDWAAPHRTVPAAQHAFPVLCAWPGQIADSRADKNGPHHSIFGVRKDKEFLESKRLGLPTAKGAGPYLSGTTYTGDWADNHREGYGVLTKASHRTAPRRTAPHRTAPHRTAPHRTTPHRTAPHRTAPRRAAPRIAERWLLATATAPDASLRRVCLELGARLGLIATTCRALETCL